MDLDDEELEATKKLNGVAKESNIFEELKKKIREAKTEEEMVGALQETIELAMKTVDRMTEHIAKQSIRIKELEEENAEIKNTKMNEYLHHNLWLAKYLNELYMPVQKVKDKIEELKQKRKKEPQGTVRDFILVEEIKFLEELLEEK